jgi:chitin disaccharide deacetylase
MTETTRRRIWLCADDYGISPAVNGAIRDLIGRKRINAASVMVTAPTFSHGEAAALLAAAGHHAAIGLHLTLTAPFAPHARGFAPLRHGAFLPLASMARRALSRTLQPALLDAEISGQFAAFRAAFGRAPDYVDGHQHIHVFPQVSEALLRVTQHLAPHAWLRQCGRAVRTNLEPKALILDALSGRFRRLATAHGLRTNPAFAGTYAFRARADYAKLFPHFLDRLPDGGVVMCHPGKVDAELTRLDPLTDLREREYAFFLSEGFPRLLAARGVTLVHPSSAHSRASGNPDAAH